MKGDECRRAEYIDRSVCQDDAISVPGASSSARKAHTLDNLKKINEARRLAGDPSSLTPEDLAKKKKAQAKV